MIPATIIREALADGVRLALSTTGNIKAIGDSAAVNRWLAVIREHKAEIIEALKVGAGDTATHADKVLRLAAANAGLKLKPGGQPSAPLTASEEMAIRGWLALIKETDPATIAEVIGRCQRDADARGYFMGRARLELPKPDPFPDDRRTCSQCLNLRGRVCGIAKPGGLVSANAGYRPMADTPHRCAGYLPNATDTNQQAGRERWPGLIQKGAE